MAKHASTEGGLGLAPEPSAYPSVETADEEQSGRKKGGGAWRVVFVLALIVFVAALVAIGVIAYSYYEGQQKYDAVAEKAAVTEGEFTQEGLEKLTVDWNALYASNPDTVAWIYMPGTAINYPVVQAADNDYYLTHDFDGVQGWLANYGAIFMDYRNKREMTDQAYFIYGHHMNDGSMFADLAGLTEQGRFDQCRTIYLLTPYGNFKLRTYTLIHCAASEQLVQPTFGTPEELASYVQDKISRSVVAPGDIPSADKIRKTFALSTCDNYADNGRYVLYSYIEETSADGLGGTLGLSTNEEGAVSGFQNGLAVDESAQGQAQE